MKLFLIAIACGLAAALVLVLFATIASASVIAMASDGGVVVSLTDEPCALPTVTNLPLRATWLEKGKVTEGCYGLANGIIMSYWGDLTVTAVPVEAFRKAGAI